MIFVRGIGVCVHTEDSTVGCPELVVVVPLRFDAQIVVTHRFARMCAGVGICARE